VIADLARLPRDRPYLRCSGGGGRRRRAARRIRSGGRGLQDGRHHQAVPHAVAHGRRAGRDQRCARQHGGGQLAVAHVSDLRCNR
jgi:hypothetical protein